MCLLASVVGSVRSLSSSHNKHFITLSHLIAFVHTLNAQDSRVVMYFQAAPSSAQACPNRDRALSVSPRNFDIHFSAICILEECEIRDGSQAIDLDGPFRVDGMCNKIEGDFGGP